MKRLPQGGVGVPTPPQALSEGQFSRGHTARSPIRGHLAPYERQIHTPRAPVLMLPKKTHPPPGPRDRSPRAPTPCDRAARGENPAKFNPPRPPPRQDSLERIQPRAKSSRNLSPSRATTASGLPPAARSHTTRAPERHGQRPTKPRPGLALGWSRRQSPSSGARVYSIYQVRPTRCNRRLHRFHHPTLDLRSRRAL